MEEQTVSFELEKYKKGAFNLLVPTTHIQQINPYFRICLEEVYIDSNPDKGDVYKVGSRNIEKDSNKRPKWENLYSPSKPALMRLASAAGIVWDPNHTRAVSVTRDYVYYEAMGGLRKASGEAIKAKASKELDMTVIEEELLEANLVKAKEITPEKRKGLNEAEWAKQQTKTAMIQWRKNKVTRAETGAILRVIRALLGMKSQYTEAELARPFVVPRVDFYPDFSDPTVRRFMSENGIRAANDLFGNGVVPMPTILTDATVVEAPEDEEEPADNQTQQEPEVVEHPEGYKLVNMEPGTSGNGTQFMKLTVLDIKSEKAMYVYVKEPALLSRLDEISNQAFFTLEYEVEGKVNVLKSFQIIQGGKSA